MSNGNEYDHALTLRTRAAAMALNSVLIYTGGCCSGQRLLKEFDKLFWFQVSQMISINKLETVQLYVFSGDFVAENSQIRPKQGFF